MSKIINNKIKNFIIIMLLVYSLALQFYFVPRLPEKYFYDSNGIIYLVNGGDYKNFDSSYTFTADFFKIINIFNFTEFNQWAILITLIMNIVTITFLLKYKNISLFDMIFILLTITLANIYIYRISKDLIQLFFWLMILLSIKVLNKKRFIIMICIYVMEGIYFRSYYFAIVLATILLFILLCKEKRNNVTKILFYSLLVCFIGLNVLKFAMPNSYNYLINLRFLINRNRLDSQDAVTIINDIIKGNDNVLTFMLNYMINFIRLLFPVELTTKGIKYIPFIAYQLYFTYSLISSSKFVLDNKYKKYYIYIAIILGYLSIANLFEPDFGSLIRHEIALYFIYLKLFLEVKIERINKNEN